MMRRYSFAATLFSLAFMGACGTEVTTASSGTGGLGNNTQSTSTNSTEPSNSNGGSNGQNSATSGGAKSSSSMQSPGEGGNDSNGGAENDDGGSSASPNGGSKPSGGSTANNSGGSTANNSGGSTANNSGGTKTNTGGSTANNSGGTKTNTGGSSSTSSSGSTSPVTAIGGSHSGEATFYDPNGNGNCSFGTAVNGKDIAALNNPDYSLAAWCGACAEVTGPKGKVVVLIQDRCPECKSGDLDLNPAAFDKIAEHSAGRVKITWNFVPCDVTGPVKYHFKEGSSAGWTAVQILNHRLPVAKFEYSTDNGSTWKAVSRVEYNYFIAESGFGPNITQVRITSSTGQTLIDTLPIPTSDRTFEGQANF